MQSVAAGPQSAPNREPPVGAAALAIADWRRSIAELYASVRAAPSPHAGYVHWRAVRAILFRSHPASPIAPKRRARYPGIATFDYDPALRFLATIDTPKNDRSALDVETSEGNLRLRPAGRTKGLQTALGRELTIYWIEGYAGGLFLPFRDATSGTETYGGGRYLIDTIKGADLGATSTGQLILDFNFAYHPSCAYDDRWVCPLPARDNTLSVPIRAGERL